MHWRSRDSLPASGTVFERRQLAESVFEKPARLLAVLFFATIFGVPALTAFLMLFVDLN